MQSGFPAARYFRGLCWIAVITCLLMSFAACLGEEHWFLDLFSHFRPVYFLGLVLAAMVALAGRRWFLAVISAVGIFINGHAIAPHWHASPLKTEPGGVAGAPVFHVATINLLYDNREHAALIHLLRTRQPDLVLLQEVSNQWMDVMRELSDIYPWQQFDHQVLNWFGLGVLSRKKWSASEIIRLGESPDGLGIAAHLEFNGRKIAVLDIHGYHPTAAAKIREVEFYQDSILRWAAEQKRRGMAVIVGGDFNCTPWSAPFRRFMKRTDLCDTSQGCVFGATRNVWWPTRIMIDHFFVSRDWKLLEREVGGAIGSDHRPLFLDLAPGSEAGN
jgi:endonuclease/exonuclease/phosphatase (EEP) superfamily protein YafD